MTMNHERKRSVGQTREFLIELLSPSKTPKVPRRVRDDARACLRHFPSDHELIGPYFKEEVYGPGPGDLEEEEEEGPAAETAGPNH